MITKCVFYCVALDRTLFRTVSLLDLFFFALAKHQIAQAPTSQSGSGGRSVSSDQSNTVTFHIWQTISMVTCAKLQQSCQSSLYRELGELIREKAFCQPSASKSQSLPNLPLFIIFDHFDSPFSSLIISAARKGSSVGCALFFVSLSLSLAWRVDFVFDSSKQAWCCARRLALLHLEGKKRKKRRYLCPVVGYIATLQDWNLMCRSPVSVICMSYIFRESERR